MEFIAHYLSKAFWLAAYIVFISEAFLAVKLLVGVLIGIVKGDEKAKGFGLLWFLAVGFSSLIAASFALDELHFVLAVFGIGGVLFCLFYWVYSISEKIQKKEKEEEYIDKN